MILPLENTLETSKEKDSLKFEVLIDDKGNYKIQNIIVEQDSVESKLIVLKNKGLNNMIIRSEQLIEVKHIIYIMDIAKRNKIKYELALKSQ